MSGDDDFAGHSKAPWHYSPTHYGKAFDIGAADGDNVALVYGPEENGSDFFRANARLIAEAPAMAELLEGFCEYMRWNADPPDCLIEARALLARIKGETP